MVPLLSPAVLWIVSDCEDNPDRKKKISLYVGFHKKLIPWKSRILNPKNSSEFEEFSGYLPVRFAKYLFKNIYKQYNMLKKSLLYKKKTSFKGK